MIGRTTALLMFAAAIAPATDEDLPVGEQETIERKFPAAANVEIDNFEGSITVTGSNTREIEVVIHKTIRSRSAERISEARRDVVLDMSQSGDDVRMYVDGPFRCRCKDGSINWRGSRFYGYQVSFEFEVKVPRETNLRLRTVNRGNIRVDNTAGAFDVENVNGGVDLIEVAGSGHAYALNRPLKVLFSRNPAGASDFGSLNGDVDISFRPGLSADVWLKTFNGQAYTDFEVVSLPPRPAVREQRNGKFVYKGNQFYGVRVGQGGPALKFDAFNGNIEIRNRGN